MRDQPYKHKNKKTRKKKAGRRSLFNAQRMSLFGDSRGEGLPQNAQGKGLLKTRITSFFSARKKALSKETQAGSSPKAQETDEPKVQKDRVLKKNKKNKGGLFSLSSVNNNEYLDSSLNETKKIYIKPGDGIGKTWLIAIAVTALVLAIVFWVAPEFVETLKNRIRQASPAREEINLIYQDKGYCVLKVPFTDLYDMPDMRASRMTQVLYNELMKITEAEAEGFVGVELKDGTRGYVLSRDISYDTRSVEPALYEYKLTIIVKTKRIMSHAYSGSILVEGVMGTHLYSDYGGEGIYRVALAGGGYGWISSEGVVRTEVDEELLPSTGRKFYETALFFANTTYIPEGLTVYGASANGIIYVASKVNGLNLPRDIQGISKFGTEVPLVFEESGTLNFQGIREGDLMFFAPDTGTQDEPAQEKPEKYSNVGIVVGSGKILISGQGSTSTKIMDINSAFFTGQRPVLVKRLFDE